MDCVCSKEMQEDPEIMAKMLHQYLQGGEAGSVIMQTVKRSKQKTSKIDMSRNLSYNFSVKNTFVHKM